MFFAVSLTTSRDNTLVRPQPLPDPYSLIILPFSVKPQQEIIVI
jgi:hypothetical protein